MSAVRLLLAAGLLLGYGLLCWWVIDRPRRRQTLPSSRAAAGIRPSATQAAWRVPVLVLHASQTGQAEGLAWQAAQRLNEAGVPVEVMPLGAATQERLRQTARALLIISTTGDGEAPDSALRFESEQMLPLAPGDLAPLQIGMLALGDRRYAKFCAFAHRVHAWLTAAGAQEVQPLIEVDAMDPQALSHWQDRLTHWGGAAAPRADAAFEQGQAMPAAQPSAWSAWTLARREVLNPGSVGAPVYHLELLPAVGQAAVDWRAGDLVQVQLPGDEGQPRDYTVASLPEDGHVHLMVRLHRRDDGRPGRCSHWLGEQLRVGESVQLRLRAQPGFRSCDHADRPLILIGSGTGLAGLLAHLRARARLKSHQTDAPPVWLLYGERQAAHDAHYDAELQRWQAGGVLRHLDRAFSRDAAPRHVQSLLLQQADRLRHWLAQGAALYVCGSRHGMGESVHAQLLHVLGESAVQTLLQSGRYRRDVY